MALGLAWQLATPSASYSQPPALHQTVLQESIPSPPEKLPNPPPEPDRKPFAITLPAALQLGNANAIDIAAAVERLQVAAAQLRQAQVLWLPSVALGGDYFRHDGTNQDAVGGMFSSSKNSVMFGIGSAPGAAAIISINDAIFAPLAARQIVRARQADEQAAANDTLVAVSEAYFTVQQARGELAGALDVTRRTEELVRRTTKLAESLVPPVEAIRAEAELARREQANMLARERWEVASAELLRIIRIDPTTQIEPVEPPHLRVTLVDLNQSIDTLIPIGLTYRPELASRQAQVQATLVLLRQERLRPLVPSLLLRGASTTPTGTLGYGVYGGGVNGHTGDFGGRYDGDVQLLWQLDNLGFGNRARVDLRRAEQRLATVELFRVQDRVAAEINQAYAQAVQAAKRVVAAERGVKLSVGSAEKNLAGLSQTKRAGDVVLLVVRPQEAVASVIALAQSYNDYYGAVADANRAQFRLYRALGKPAQCLVTPTGEVATALPLPQQ
jgi:outer membrane protein TolC